MNKEPLGLYVFRFILGLGLFAFMLMLYWSSVLLEQDLKEVRVDLAQIQGDVYNLRNDTQGISQTVLKAILDDQRHREQELQQWRANPAADNLPVRIQPVEEVVAVGSHPHIDDKYPNLLQTDPFYADTLPKLLGANFRPLGTQKSAAIGKPDDLHPFSNWANVSAWTSQCIVSLAKLQFGKYETMAPDMAIKIEERVTPETSIPEYWIHLRDNVYWQPLNPKHFPAGVVLAPHFLQKHQVTAHDYKFYFDALMNPFMQEDGAVALRNYLGDIQEIKVIDDLTFVVKWKTDNVTQPDGSVMPKVKYTARQLTGGLTPLPRFVYQYFADGKKIVEEDSDPDTYRKNSVWAQNFSQHWAKNIIVGCGAWAFDGMTDQQINFVRNPDHYDPLAALSGRMETTFKDAPEAIWLDFKAGKLDTYMLMPDRLIELQKFLDSPEYQAQAQTKQGLAVHQIRYLNRAYTYIGWNSARPLFASKAVRRAMTLAIDRKRIIEQNLNKMGEEITGPFFKDSPSNDAAVASLPYDPREAKRLLEAEGWYDSDGDGIIDKEIDGKRVPFRFALTYYVKNPVTKAICEYVSTTLKEIGIDCQPHGVDSADLSAAFEDKNFDAIFFGWMLGTPPEEPKQLWYSTGAKEKGSSNAVGFANKEADSIIDQLQYEYDSDKRQQLYHRFHQIIADEQPYTFLYTPKSTLVYRDYVQNVFIPKERQDLIPGANISSPDSSIFWLKQEG